MLTIIFLLLIPTSIILGIIILLSYFFCNYNNNIDNPNDMQRLSDLNKRIVASHFGFATKGETGENYIEMQLLNLNIPKKIIRNAYIPYKGGTSEIDLILITEYGFYVIESKNYSGWIFGSQNNYMWTQSLNRNSKYKFYNPILQNKNHIEALSNYLNMDLKKFHSFIVFGSNSEFKKIPPNTNQYHIMYEHQICEYLYYDIQHKNKIFTEEYLERLYIQILPTTNVSEEIRQQHIYHAQQHR